MGVIVNPFVSKWGLGTFVLTSSTIAASGRYPLALINGKSGDATFKVNGTSISVGGAKADLALSHHAVVCYQLQCGSVSNIPMGSGGTVGYTAPMATADSTSISKGLVIPGTTLPMAVGVVSYTITNGGTGYPAAFYTVIPGGTFTSSASVLGRSTGGVVTSLVPYTGSWTGYGTGYAGNFSTSLNGGSVNVPTGSGLTFDCIVGNYITHIPVTSGGTGLTTKPTITIIDSGSGSGAAAWPNMSGPALTDTVTYSAPANWLTTVLGDAPAATDQPVFNYAYPYIIESSAVSLPGFDIPPTMKFGGEHPVQAAYSEESHSFTSKDKMLASSDWTGASVTMDANKNPLSWSAGGTISADIYKSALGFAPMAGTGDWVIKYLDSGAATTTIALAYTNVYSSGGTPTKTVVGNLVTITVPVVFSWTPGSYTNAIVQLHWTSSDGLNHVTHPNNPNVFRPLVMAPGNTDRGLFYDADDVIIANLTGPAGTTPSLIRWMDILWDYGGVNNYCQPADRIPANLSTWNDSGASSSTSGTYQFQFARFYNTDPAKSSTGDNTYPWPASTKFYNSGCIETGSDAQGAYLLVADGPYGASDNGRILVGPSQTPQHYGLVELRSTSPHQLSSGQYCVINPNNGTGYTIPWTIRGSINSFYPGFTASVNIYVTGPNTIVMAFPFTSDVGSVSDTVNSTSEIAVSIGVILGSPIAGSKCVPTQYACGFVSRLPHTDLWLNLPATGTSQHDMTGYHYSEGVICANSLGPNNGVCLELGNELWNSGVNEAGFSYMGTSVNFALYAPIGASIFGGYVTATGGYLTGGNQGPQALIGAMAYDAFVAGWVSTGRSASQVKRYYGASWGDSSTTNGLAGNITTFHLPCDGIAVAPYEGMSNPFGPPADNSYVDAFSPAGLNGVYNSAESWPVWQLNDVLSFYVAFDANIVNNQFGSHAAYTIPAGIPLVYYEGGYQSLTPDAEPIPQYVAEDMMNHPSFRDAIKRFLVFEQLGYWPSKAVGAGGVNSNYYTWCGSGGTPGNPGWRLTAGPLQAPGLGTSNSYLIPQGGVDGQSSGGNTYIDPTHGSSGYSPINVAPGLQAMIEWNAATGGPVVPPQPSIPQKAAVLVGL